MARTRSPLETAVVAWIALKIISLLLGFGLTVETLSKPSGARLDPDVGRAVGYASIGLLVLIVVLLVAEGKYLLAAGLVAVAIAVPLIIETHDVSVTLRRPIPGRAVGPQPPRPLLSNGVRTAFATRAAAIPVADLYDAVLAGSRIPSTVLIVSQGRPACARMTAAARAQLERALLGGSSSAPRECQLALWVAARRGTFGRPDLHAASLLDGIAASADVRTAQFVARNGVRLKLIAPASGEWLISGFAGGAFARR
jgi:hypothetical protein